MKKNNKENMGVDFEPEIEKMNVKQLFEYSGLSRCAWCEALGISYSRWGQIHADFLNVPKKIIKKARKIAVNGAAIRRWEIDAEDTKTLKKIKDIIFCSEKKGE